MKKKFYQWLPTCVLVALIGVDAAYLMKNQKDYNSLNAESYKGWMHYYLEAKGIKVKGSGSAKFQIAGDTGFGGGVSGEVGVTGKISADELVPIYKRECYSGMGCWTSCSATEWEAINTRFWGSSNAVLGCNFK